MNNVPRATEVQILEFYKIYMPVFFYFLSRPIWKRKHDPSGVWPVKINVIKRYGQRVILEDIAHSSSREVVTSGVTQGSVLGPQLL